MRRAPLQALLVALALAPSSRAGAYGRYDGTATPIFTQEYEIPSGATVTFETEIMSSGGDTVMHLLDNAGNEVAMNDDYNGLASRIQYTPPSPGGVFTLVVRAYSNSTAGYCKIYKDGQLAAWDIPFAGWFVADEASHVDVLQTVLVNGGVPDTVLWSFSDSGHVLSVDDDSGVGAASRIAVTAISAFLAVSTYWGSGAARVIVNDAGNDHDGDGLGGALETALCTCDQEVGPPVCGNYCLSSFLRSTQDSDGDGIRDDYEVFGIDDPTFPQHLPMWGADPTHKDLFVEMDLLGGVPTISVENLQKIVDAYAPARSTQQYLDNRDGLPGIRVHIDVGGAIAPSGTSWGNWGGANTVTAVNYDNPSPADFALVRRGIFHYGISMAGVCNAPYDGWGYCAGYNNPVFGHAHELGHNLSLRHGGTKSSFPANAKPHYQSIMNYAMSSAITETFSFGDYNAVSLNPDDLCEANGLGVSDDSKVSYLAGGDFKFTVEANCASDGNPACGIDWNRDGTISDCSKHLKAAVTDNFSGGQELGRHYWQVWSPPFSTANADPTAAPSLMRFAGRLYLAFRTTAGAIALWYTAHDFVSGCTSPFDSGCAPWTQLTVPGAAAQSGGPALGVINTDGIDQLVVVWREGSMLKYALVTPQDQISFPAFVPGSFLAIHEPSLASNGADLLLVYRTGVALLPPGLGQVRANTWVAGQATWQDAAIQMRYGYLGAFPAISVLAAASHPGGVRAMFGYQDQMGNYRAMWLDYAGNNNWIDVTGSNLDTTVQFDEPPTRRIGLAYVAHAASTGLTGGRWYTVYPGHADPPGTSTKVFETTMTRGDGTNAPLTWLATANYDNWWRVTRGGVGLYAWRPGNPETNLRMATVFSMQVTVDEPLEFRPFADGIIPASMKDSNDWVTIERGLCTSIQGCTNPMCNFYQENWCAQHD